MLRAVSKGIRSEGTVEINLQQALASAGETLKATAHDLFSIWLAVQIAEIGLAAGIAAAAANVAQRRVKLLELTAGWPGPLREFCRLVLANIGTLVFVFVIAVIHGAMLSLTWPSRSYLLGVASSLATAWFVIAVVAGLIRNRFV